MKNGDLKKTIRGLLDEMQAVFQQEETLRESLEESDRQLCQPGFGWDGEEFRRIALGMDRTYSAVADLMPRVGKCVRACAFYEPECGRVHKRFGEFKERIGPVSASDEMRVSVPEVLIELRSLLMDTLRVVSEEPMAE